MNALFSRGPIHVATLLLVISCWMSPAPCQAQFRITNGTAEQTTNIFLPAPRDLRQQLARAKKALDQQEYADAVDLLGRLLADPQINSGGADPTLEQDYFVSEPGQEGTRTSLKAEAQRLLGAMPAKGRALYELKFGSEARRLLDRAINQADLRQLTQVTRRYFHTDAGYEATFLLGRHELDQGRPLAAALCFQRLEKTTYARDRYDPELSVLLATSWLVARQDQRVRDTLLDLRQRDSAATLRIGTQMVSLFGEGKDPLEWLEGIIGKGFVLANQSEIEWVMYRGDVDRNATTHAGFPLLNVRWRVRVANHPTDEQILQMSQRNFWDQGVPALCSMHPLAVADVILMRTPRRLIAVDFATGKRIWEFPWFESSGQSGSGPAGATRNISIASRQRELNQRVWDDAAYGQMSSDGQRVFFLWQLGYADPSARAVGGIIMPQGRLASNPNAPRDTNKLVALDLKQEGKLQWMVGGNDGTDEPKLAGAFFLGAPLPLMDRLYVLAEVKSEIRLVVLDAASGRLQWSQQLAHVDTRKIQLDAPRRLAGASPSYSDGVLVCPTSAGAAVAVDVATRSLLWGYQYPQASVPTHVMMSALRFPLRPTGQRWADGTVTIANGKVLLTPVESDHLYCLDLLTGKPLWKPRPRNGMLYLACVANDRAVLVGKERVQAVALADGSDVWTLPLEDSMPAGRGMRADDSYYLATTANRLLKIDLDTGRIIHESQTDGVLGNLLAYKGQIISQGADWLSAYYQTEPLRGLVSKRLRENPDDVWALARSAELLLYDGKRREAVAVLRHALEVAPDDDAVHALLVTSIVAALREDFAANRGLAADLDTMIDQPRQRMEYYRLMAVGLQDVGEYAKSLEYYVKFASMETTPTLRSSTGRDQLIKVSPQLRVCRDRWVRTQLARMFDTIKPDARPRMEAAVQRYYDQIVAAQNPKPLTRFIEHFAASDLAGNARLELAKLLIGREQWLAAEQNLIALQSDQRPELAAAATELLADMFRRTGRMEEAVLCFRQLAKRWPDVTLAGGKTATQWVDEAKSDKTLQPLFQDRETWPYGKCDVHEGPTGARPFSSFQRIYSVDLTGVQGPFPPQARVAFNFNLNSLLIRDRFGRTTQQLLLGDQNRFYTSYYAANHAAARGHLMLAAIGFEIVAVDTLRATEDATDPILWRKDLSSAAGLTGQRSLMANTINRPWGPPRILPRERSRQLIGLLGPITASGVVYQKLHEIICVDPLTNFSNWQRSGFATGSDLFGDDQYLFVVEPDSHAATVLRTVDGTELGQREVGTRAVRWLTRGRNVLTCEARNGKLGVRWFDAWTEKTIWERQFEGTSQCWQIDPNSIAIMERSGTLLIFDLDTGKPLFETQLLPEPRLARLYVLASRDRYFVVASAQSGRSVSSSVTGTRIYGISTADQCPLVSGHVYALDRRSGKPIWPEPALIRQFALPLNQPAAAPALVFFRHMSRRTTGSVPRSSPTTASVLCIDKRDGRQLLHAKDLSMIQYYSIEADLDNHSVVVATNARTFTLTFTNQPVKDVKPVQQEDPTAAINALMEVGRIAGSIMQAMSRANGQGAKKTPDVKKTQETKKDQAAKTTKTPAKNPAAPAAKKNAPPAAKQPPPKTPTEAQPTKPPLPR